MEESILLSAKAIVTDMIAAKESREDLVVITKLIKNLENKISHRDREMELISQKLDSLLKHLK